VPDTPVSRAIIRRWHLGMDRHRRFLDSGMLG